MTSFRKADPSDRLLLRLRRRARRLTRTADEAEDLVQDAALRLLQMEQNGAQIVARESYAMVTLYNLARQRWRDRHPTEELAEEMLSTLPAAPGRIACAEIAAAIERLPCEQATLMRLVAQGETSPAELAHLAHCPIGTVMSRLARARTKLRADMHLKPDAPVSELL